MAGMLAGIPPPYAKPSPNIAATPAAREIGSLGFESPSEAYMTVSWFCLRLFVSDSVCR